MIKMLTVLSRISNSQAFLLKKNVTSLQKLLTFFSAKKKKKKKKKKKSSLFAIFNDQSFNGMLTNDIVGFHHETRLYNFDPLKAHFYIEKLGFTGVYMFFLISAQNRRGGSNEYPQSMF